MKTVSKTAILVFLVTLTLASCGGFPSPSAMSPTDQMEVTVIETQTKIPTATPSPPPTLIPPTQTPFFSIPFDRHDPESVIRAFFDAWERKDRNALASILSGNRGETVFEPTDSIKIQEIKLISSSPTERVYKVVFEIKVQGEGISMHSGRYGWKYHLTWDANRDSWLITNYGYP